MFELEIEKLVHGGQGLSHDETGHPFFVWNALPGETVLAERIAKKKDYSEAIAKEIVTPSSHRLTVREASYLSTSPWQIMDLAYENTMKMDIARDTYKHLGGLEITPEIATDSVEYGYRNKMEFSFTQDEAGVIQLAFFNRGTKTKIPVAGSLLASPAIQKAAEHILIWIREQKITNRSLKAIIIRSNQKGEVIAGLFIKDELEFKKYPELTSGLVGFTLYYSTHKSPASVPTKLLYHEGHKYLEEIILNTTLRYGLFSFFQVNIPVCEMALRDIGEYIMPDIPLVDYYSGVGTISLALSDKISSCIQVEDNQEAVSFSQENQKLISSHKESQKFESFCSPAEKLLDYITSDIQIILDPPRAGLHEKVTQRILQTLPSRIIYLSCNIATQARDLKMLSEQYTISFSRLYNFFPHTPHIEGLVVLDKKV
ncbi:MAG: hypothetical protein WC045_00545 [Patescibacteria group bacterium]